jgi:hypothetical protein
MNICFLITSVIQTLSTPLIYGPRSYYTSYSRYKQTLQTIDTIRNYVPNAYIYLVEGSKLDKQLEEVLETKVNRYVNLSELDYVEKSIDSILKGYGEAVQTHYMLSYIIGNECEYVFKISGRYYLNENFYLKRLLRPNKVAFCKGKSTNPPIVSTVLYSFPSKDIPLLIRAFEKMIEIYKDYEEKQNIRRETLPHFEKLLPSFLDEYTILETVGIEGLVSSYQTLYKC